MNTTNCLATPLEAIAGFAGLLRDHGLKVGVAEQQAMVKAALCVPLGRPAMLGDAWRAIACHDARDWRRWPDLFERYWHPQRAKGNSKLSGQTRPSRNLQQLVKTLHDSMDSSKPAARPGSADTALDAPAVVTDDNGLARAQGGASQTDALHDRALSQWLPQDLAQLERLAERIARMLRKRLTRRWHDRPAGNRLDLRRTLRASLRTGGLPINPVWRTQRREQPRLFILVDVSRSMEMHAQFFLRLSRAFVEVMNARAFVFHTRLAEVTPLMKRRSEKIQDKVNAVSFGFGGGTRIASCLHEALHQHLGRDLRHGDLFIVFSDGFDTDEPQELALVLAQIRARGARICWLHPTVIAPQSAAMLLAAPHVNRFMPVHNLASLSRLPDLLA